MVTIIILDSRNKSMFGDLNSTLLDDVASAGFRNNEAPIQDAIEVMQRKFEQASSFVITGIIKIEDTTEEHYRNQPHLRLFCKVEPKKKELADFDMPIISKGI